MDRELIAERPDGIIATTGCPSGEVQTRLRLGPVRRGQGRGRAYQEIFGRENYFLELMDHGLAIEREVRDGLLRLAEDLDLPLLATNDAHYVTEDQADAHDNLLCIGVGKNKDDPRRFRFNGSGYYLKPAAEMRALFAELPGGLRQHAAGRRARRVVRRGLRPRRRDAAVPGRARGRDAGVVAAEGGPRGPGPALRGPGPAACPGAVRDRDVGHRPDGLQLVLPRRGGHLPVRPRRTASRSARAAARPPAPSSPTPPASPNCARWSTACSSNGS